MNPWLFAFIVSFVLLLLLADWKQIAINIYGGIISAFYQLAELLLAYNLGLWKSNNVDLNLPNWIIFSNSTNIFFAGITFLLGIIFLQYLPRNLGLQFIHAFIWALFFVAFAFISKGYNLITYDHFRFYMATHVLIFFLTLAWFKTFWLWRRNTPDFSR